MKIKTNAWHARFIRATWCEMFDADMPRSLCSYFWILVFSTVFSVLLSALALALSPILGPVLGAVWLYGRWEEWKKEQQAREYEAAKREGRLDEYNAKYFGKKEKKRKKPGLLRSFIKAKKQKVCPLIQYEK